MEIHGNAYPPFVPPGAALDSKTIRIIDGRYNLQFTVQDGEWIAVNGKPFQVHYIDETHFKINGQYFHICQFGEKAIDQGIVVEKLNKETAMDGKE